MPGLDSKVNLYSVDDLMLIIDKNNFTPSQVELAFGDVKYNLASLYEHKSDKKGNSSKWYLWVLVIALVAGAGVGGWFLYDKYGNSASAAPSYDRNDGIDAEDSIGTNTMSVATNIKAKLVDDDIPA